MRSARCRSTNTRRTCRAAARSRSSLAWLRNYVGYELAWDVRLVLRERTCRAPRSAAAGRLGWTTWLGQRRRGTDADDLVLVHETIVARSRSHEAALTTSAAQSHRPRLTHE